MDINSNELEILKNVQNTLNQRFAEDIKIFDTRNLSSLSDYVVIATGKNSPQIKALADSVEETLEKCGYTLKQREGSTSSTWILLDFINIIVHIFNPEDRTYYDLDKFWTDAPTLDLD